MLSALLLAGLIASPIATVALFVPTGRRARRAEERAKWIARLACALLWAAVLIAAVVGILALIGVTAGNIAAAAIGLTLACLVWLPVTRRWNARAHVCWATSTYGLPEGAPRDTASSDAAISSNVPPRCTVPALRHSCAVQGTGPLSA